MSKNVTLFVLALALILGAAGLQAQEGGKVPQFSTAPKVGTVVQLEPNTKIDFKNMADLTPFELEKAFENPSCGGNKADKSATACAFCTGLNCTGNCYAVPCGFGINANQQVPPQAGFRSFVTGCNTTIISTCNNLSSAPPCQAFAFASATWGNNTCINSNSFAFQSGGCFN